MTMDGFDIRALRLSHVIPANAPLQQLATGFRRSGGALRNGLSIATRALYAMDLYRRGVLRP
jgi:hypothetical protein